ncbi:camp-regulated phosphoprotein family protein Igo1 [Thelonectria olida]|uniref:mRNA stability protein n=1 Tax=Thelonectria olida TaxID=1576542 RepID=A0A9P9AIC3_9HYPO|nr:camp-regulated phosphoprotein family protein Igo1 [Thelonectria olida]
MDPAKHPDPPTERDKNLLRKYGTTITRGNLLHHQLERRTYFDSGDFALSQARRPSNIGAVDTGNEHPIRKNISHPSAPAPSSSNVDDDAGQDFRDETKTKSRPASHHQEEVATQTRVGPGDSKQDSNV